MTDVNYLYDSHNLLIRGSDHIIRMECSIEHRGPLFDNDDMIIGRIYKEVSNDMALAIYNDIDVTVFSGPLTVRHVLSAIRLRNPTVDPPADSFVIMIGDIKMFPSWALLYDIGLYREGRRVGLYTMSESDALEMRLML